MAKTIFQNIPFSFLYEWSRKHTAVYPTLTYVNSLATKGGLTTVGDVYANTLKSCKKLNDLRAELTALAADIEDAYEDSTSVIVLPSTSGLSVTDSVTEFIREFADLMDQRVKKHENHQTAREGRAKIFRLYNVQGSSPTAGLRDMDYVATAMGISRERVRQITTELADMGRRIFLGETVEQVCADPSLVSWFTDIDAKLASAMPLSAFYKITGLDGGNPYAERFIMDMLGMSLSTDKSREAFVSRGDLSFFGKMGRLVKFLRDNPLPVPATDVDVFLKKTFKDAETRRNIMDFIRHSSDYEFTTDAQGIEYVALKWENLEFLSSEVARILFDKKAFEVKDAMSKEELIDEYNTRARLFKKDTIDSNTPGLGSHPMVLALGKSGYYKIKKYKEIFVAGLDFAHEYVRINKEKSNLRDFIAKCDAEGYLKVYGERSMTSFFYTALQPLSGNSSDAKEKTTIPIETVMQVTAEELAKAGAPVQASALFRLVSARIAGLADQTFRLYLRRGAGVLFTLTPKGTKCLMVGLIPEDIENFDFSQFAVKTREAAYKSVVVATAVDELRSVEGHKMPLKVLVKKLKSLLPSSIAPNNIYKNFTDSNIFVKTSMGNKRGDLFVELNPETYRELYQKPEAVAKPAVAVAVAAPAPATATETKGDVFEVGFDWTKLRTTLAGQFRQVAGGPGMNMRDIINEMYDIMRGENAEVEEGTEEYKILSLLNNYYLGKTSAYDRELLALKLVMGLEPYLKSYYRKVKGSSLFGVSGLSHVIQKLQDEYFLPNDEDGTNIGKGLNNIIGPVISRRNKIHTNFEGLSGCLDINKTMGLFLMFYVLTAAYSLYYVD